MCGGGGGGDTTAQMIRIREQLARANARADEALGETKKAAEAARLASAPVADSEAARKAAEAQMRRMLKSNPSTLYANAKQRAPLGFRVLTEAT